MDELRNFVTAQHLQSHWKVLPAELLDFIHGGLPAYRQTGIAIEAEELLPEKTLFDITKELLLRAVRNSEAERCRRIITLANIPSSFHPRDFKSPIEIAPPNTSAPTETVSDIDTEAKRVFKKLKKRKDTQTISEFNTFFFKRDEINHFAQLHDLKPIDKAEAPPDINPTTQPPTSIESCVPHVKDCDSPPVQTSAAKLVTLTRVQEDKWDAREAAEKYIRGCKKRSAPSIKEAVVKVNAKLKKSYEAKTIRNWIKDLFPTESRKPGRRPNKG